MSLDSSLAWSYHSTKLSAGFGVVVVAGVAFLAGLVSSDPRLDLVGSIGAVVVLFALLLLGYTVTCPACRLRLLFHSMSTQSAGNWVHHAVYTASCPRCGFRPRGRDVSSNTSLERTREG